ncbi:hypothetical protein GCM10017779_45820 [Streptomyces capillispiralis]|nr:hypothetical protein GCM10017779_45820 [Streptomyces capillispiralis]
MLLFRAGRRPCGGAGAGADRRAHPAGSSRAHVRPHGAPRVRASRAVRTGGAGDVPVSGSAAAHEPSPSRTGGGSLLGLYNVGRLSRDDSTGPRVVSRAMTKTVAPPGRRNPRPAADPGRKI